MWYLFSLIFNNYTAFLLDDAFTSPSDSPGLHGIVGNQVMETMGGQFRHGHC